MRTTWTPPATSTGVRDTGAIGNPRHGIASRGVRSCLRRETRQPPAAGDDVGAMRWDYFERARTVGEQSPLNSGIYRLPAPTGSGKTMSSAIFALSHAVKTEKRRVIVAVPYIDHNTERERLPSDVSGPRRRIVLEHHSNILDDATADNPWRRLAAENWDAEFIVTTTVQLLESLFDNRPEPPENCIGSPTRWSSSTGAGVAGRVGAGDFADDARTQRPLRRHVLALLSDATLVLESARMGRTEAHRSGACRLHTADHPESSL